jgi:hypothetical protein
LWADLACYYLAIGKVVLAEGRAVTANPCRLGCMLDADRWYPLPRNKRSCFTATVANLHRVPLGTL